eukprot:maker-scaffold_14-snap-gene-7.24-mRNA-1 protein AED:0.35 eAED:0.67 QI:0/0/0/1/0/0/3/0/72
MMASIVARIGRFSAALEDFIQDEEDAKGRNLIFTLVPVQIYLVIKDDLLPGEELFLFIEVLPWFSVVRLRFA